MKKNYKNVLIGLLAVSLFAGCASKNVEFDGTANNGANSNAKTIQNSTDGKLDSIAGDETSVDNGFEQTTENTTDLLDTSDGINKVQSDIEGKTIVLNSVHFAFDKFNLTDNMREIATQNATKIDNVIASYSNLKIKLEGNCDEWGTDEYNYALGLKRAKSAKDALIADGIDASRIMMVSFGESNPICTDKTTNCWKLNRRVDYRLLP